MQPGLLDAAKRAVEIAIESDEASALEFLNQKEEACRKNP
jgi:hypothetical protein